MKHNPPREDSSKSRTAAEFQSAKSLDDFEIIIDDDEPIQGSAVTSAPWKILVVDDDEEVHAATEFALKDVLILDQSINLIHAYSAQECFEIVTTTSNIAVALLDVVMESEDAGLKLVEKIRNNNYHEMRIVLRTGQPGYAPELSVLRDFDINDYRTKSDLTRNRLVSLLTTSIRSYKQLHIINESKRGLELLVRSCSDIFKRKNLEMFSQGTLKQLVALLTSPSEGVVCLMTSEAVAKDIEEEFKVVTATGRFENLINRGLGSIDDDKLLKTFHESRKAPMGVYVGGALGLYFSSREGKKLFVYVENYSKVSEENLVLLKLFAGNIAVGFENLALVERLDQLAFVDSILDIPNRNAFERDFNKFRNLYNPLAVLLLHINGLSRSISVFGVPVVNQAILEIRNRLMSELDFYPYSIAFDGKADLILLVDADHIDIRGINKIFESKIQANQFQLPLEATMAIVKVDDSLDAETALRCATSAMIIAKSTPGTNLAHYDHAMGQGLTERIMLQSALRRALEHHDGIVANFQPKVSCATGELIGAEALCRWTLSGSQISPADFIPVAEASGLSLKLTDCMLAQVSQFIHKRKAIGLPLVKIAVNLSMYDLHVPNFASAMQEKLKSLELSPETVEFEITESSMMNDPQYVIDELHRFHKLGYTISIDDFGTGFSALNYLEQLPVSCLKIDKSFVDTLTVRSANQSLVASAISIAKNLGLSIVAEGVETKEQHDALLFLGCDACQGFYFARPMDMAEFNKLYGN